MNGIEIQIEFDKNPASSNRIALIMKANDVIKMKIGIPLVIVFTKNGNPAVVSETQALQSTAVGQEQERVVGKKDESPDVNGVSGGEFEVIRMGDLGDTVVEEVDVDGEIGLDLVGGEGVEQGEGVGFGLGDFKEP